MKLSSILLIVIMIFWGCNFRKTKNEQLANSNSIMKIEIKEEVEWVAIETFIDQFAITKPNLETGKDTIVKFVQENFPSFNNDFLVDIDLDATKKEFFDWKDRLT